MSRRTERMNTGALPQTRKTTKTTSKPKTHHPALSHKEILAICMIRRTSQKLSNKIPIIQVVYRAGRSTTEKCIHLKVFAEKAITSKDYETHLLILDTSEYTWLQH